MTDAMQLNGNAILISKVLSHDGTQDQKRELARTYLLRANEVLQIAAIRYIDYSLTLSEQDPEREQIERLSKSMTKAADTLMGLS